ncbi:hypothetical protein J437_LFUL011043, partial [Ladona fulva]
LGSTDQRHASKLEICCPHPTTTRLESFTSNERLIRCIQQIKKKVHDQKGEEEESILNWRIHICSENNFPTAAGLASSAAGYACLVYALSQLYGLEGDISALARQGSGSACRSIFGGFVQWNRGQDEEEGKGSIAEQIADVSHWPEMRIVILVVARFGVVTLHRLELLELGVCREGGAAFTRCALSRDGTFPPFALLSAFSGLSFSLVPSCNCRSLPSALLWRSFCFLPLSPAIALCPSWHLPCTCSNLIPCDFWHIPRPLAKEGRKGPEVLRGHFPPSDPTLAIMRKIHGNECRLATMVNDVKKKLSSTVGMRRSVETSELLKYRVQYSVPQRIEAMRKGDPSSSFPSPLYPRCSQLDSGPDSSLASSIAVCGSQETNSSLPYMFMEKSGFPRVIGAVDGTHIAIVPPVREREHDFTNRKGFHSKNVQIVNVFHPNYIINIHFRMKMD